MAETCDSCGKKFDVLSIHFTGVHFLCPDCLAKRDPRLMGSLRV